MRTATHARAPAATRSAARMTVLDPRAPTDAGAPESAPVRVGVIDAGANTLRLLVVREKRGSIATLCEERARLGLGDEIERLGRISRDEARGGRDRRRRPGRARAHARLRAPRGARHVAGAPGRQSRRAARDARARRPAHHVRLLSGEDEASSATPARRRVRRLPKSVAVVRRRRRVDPGRRRHPRRAAPPGRGRSTSARCA